MSRIHHATSAPPQPLQDYDHASTTALKTRSRKLPLVYQWIKRNKYVCPSGSTQGMTHTLQDARFAGMRGAISIPSRQLTEFYRQYARDLECGNALYMDEKSCDTPCLLLDMDFLFDSKICFTAIQPLIAFLHSALLERCEDLKTDDQKELIILESPTTRKGDKVKYGLHLIWPSICLTLENRLKIRQVFIHTADHHFPRQSFTWKDEDGRHIHSQLTNGWNDVFDLNIIKKPQCRMLGSRKLRSCKCRKGQCRTHARGFIDVGRPYTFRCFMDKDSNTVDTQPSDFSVLLQCSLQKPGVLTSVQVSDITLPTSTSSHGRTFSTPSEGKVGLVEELLHHYFPLVSIATPKFTKGDPSKGEFEHYIARITSTRYCQNHGGEHSSNGLYFVVNKLGIYRRCFCEKNERMGRYNIPCSNFQEFMKLDKVVLQPIFGAFRIPRKRRRNINTTQTDFLHQTKRRYQELIEQFHR